MSGPTVRQMEDAEDIIADYLGFKNDPEVEHALGQRCGCPGCDAEVHEMLGRVYAALHPQRREPMK